MTHTWALAGSGVRGTVRSPCRVASSAIAGEGGERMNRSPAVSGFEAQVGQPYGRMSGGAELSGKPAVIQASAPPIMLVARHSPIDLKLAAAKLELCPCRQMMTISTSSSTASGMWSAPAASSRHSSTVRSMTSTPGISPWFFRWVSVRVSTTIAPRAAAASVCCGVRRDKLARAFARSVAIPGMSSLTLLPWRFKDPAPFWVTSRWAFVEPAYAAQSGSEAVGAGRATIQ